jgi:stress response protein SCP2
VEVIKHMGDNRTGQGRGDDESIHIFLDRVPQSIERLVCH